jgi:hypothetical protein
MAEQQESVSVSGNRVRPLTQEELTALTSELQAVLEKHGAEMGVTSTINLMKVIDEPKPESTTDEAKVEESADNSTEEGS